MHRSHRLRIMKSATLFDFALDFVAGPDGSRWRSMKASEAGVGAVRSGQERGEAEYRSGRLFFLSPLHHDHLRRCQPGSPHMDLFLILVRPKCRLDSASGGTLQESKRGLLIPNPNPIPSHYHLNLICSEAQHDPKHTYSFSPH